MAASPMGSRARTTAVTGLALVVALVVGGCGDDGSAEPPSTAPASSVIPDATFPPTTPSSATVPPQTLPEVPNPVAIVDFGFEPATIEVATGETVTWVNQDEADHWVLGEEPDVVDSAPLEQGNRFAQTFDEPGTYRYFCNVHNSMRATVVVR